jgi:hypothetical protein
MPDYEIRWITRIEAASPAEAAEIARQSLTPDKVEMIWFFVMDRDTAQSERVFPLDTVTGPEPSCLRCGSDDTRPYTTKPPRRHPRSRVECDAACLVAGRFCRACRTVSRETLKET